MIQHEAQKKGAAANQAKAMERSRRVLEMVGQGKTHEEIGKALGVNTTSVRTIVLRARQRTGEVVRVGQRPAGPMQDRRTKRDRDRSSRERHAVEDSSA